MGFFPLLLSLETFTSRSSELCLSETFGLSVGSAPEHVDRGRQRAVELLSQSDHRVFSGELVELESLLVLKKKEKDAGSVWYVF